MSPQPGLTAPEAAQFARWALVSQGPLTSASAGVRWIPTANYQTTLSQLEGPDVRSHLTVVSQ